MDALQRGNLLDAGGLYVTGEDNLRLTTFGGVANLVVVMEGRLLDCDGRIVPLAERHVPNSNYTAAQSIFGLAEGVLTNVQLRIATGTAGRGGVFGVLEIVRGVAATRRRSARCSRATSRRMRALPGRARRSSQASTVRAACARSPAPTPQRALRSPRPCRWRALDARLLHRHPGDVVRSSPTARHRSYSRRRSGTTVFQLGANSTVRRRVRRPVIRGRRALGIFGSTGSGRERRRAAGSGVALCGLSHRTQTGLFDVGDNWGAPRYLVEEWIE
jgi:hypothetical protein